MAQGLLKPNSGRARAAAEARDSASAGGIVVAGTYRGKQLAWIKKNGVYNWPVKVRSRWQFCRFREEVSNVLS